MSSIADYFIAEKKIPKEDFMEWIRIGDSHLRRISYGDIHISMMKLPGEDMAIFLGQDREKQEAEQYRLTRKEKELLGYLIKGFSNKNIAASMKISPGTVNTHLDNLYTKLGCSNRLAACFIALKKGLFLPARDLPQGPKK